ncbi:copper chaperone PCu(A)C [Streptomyces sudanensis]|uniref:copper chaperone PCu(A)C n=1 Tax=Streptomyces sudanensis TaxID=436397 RepID=UPI0020CC1037|nr:copper chaperone PCu(A)C [Streptomyces sudanensis]MCP9958161.1 copper chaperone PCu(A)C [Streptomyces sudanensis]MCQ0001318.1 copper chaperone PCu(A)C [Streptomyces sudanensis]
MTRTAALSTAFALLAGLVLGGCSSAGPADGEPRPEVRGAFVPEPVNTDMAAGFLTVTNTGGAGDTLTSVTSDLSDEVQMHETKDRRMRQVDSFDLPAHGELRLERGGDHLMFMGLKRLPKQGDKIKVELRFEKSGPIEVEVPVEDRTHDPRHSGEHAPHGGHGRPHPSRQHDGTRH